MLWLKNGQKQKDWLKTLETVIFFRTCQYIHLLRLDPGVTLVSADSKQIKAHKVILSSRSKFFNQILLENPHQHPLRMIFGHFSTLYNECNEYLQHTE